MRLVTLSYLGSRTRHTTYGFKVYGIRYTIYGGAAWRRGRNRHLSTQGRPPRLRLIHPKRHARQHSPRPLPSEKKKRTDLRAQVRGMSHADRDQASFSLPNLLPPLLLPGSQTTPNIDIARTLCTIDLVTSPQLCFSIPICRSSIRKGMKRPFFDTPSTPTLLLLRLDINSPRRQPPRGPYSHRNASLPLKPSQLPLAPFPAKTPRYKPYGATPPLSTATHPPHTCGYNTPLSFGTLTYHSSCLFR